MDEFKKAETVVLVAYLDADDKSSNETFTAVAKSLREKYLFGATHDKALAEAEAIQQPAIVLFKQYDEGKSTFTDKFDKDQIAAFAKTASVPLIGEVGPETYADYMDVSVCLCTGKPWLILSIRLVFPSPTSSPRRPRSERSSRTSFDP